MVEHSSSDGGEGRSWIWLLFLAVASMLFTVVEAAAPPFRLSSSSDGGFSATRAWTDVDALATGIGRRVSGTEAGTRTADYIESRLRDFGVETERQVANGTADLDGTSYIYRGVTNVLARIPGRSPRAVLLSAHYDSAIDGAGAGDNALNVAVALEVVRAISQSAMPANTIIVNFNGAEELGLLGAAAFVHHPWFKDVAAFINLDASGPSGRQLLLQVTPGREDLLHAYAASAPHVHGTVMAQEIFQALPLDTDYHVYRDVGLGGIDLAPYGDSYAYHTSLDRTDRLSMLTLQESGENVLGLLHGLDALRPPSARQPAAKPSTYYDLLGLFMVRYSARTARIAGVVTAALSLLLVLWPRAGLRRRFALATMGTAAVSCSVLLAVLVPIFGSLLVTWTRQQMFWFARPWLAVCVYGTLAVAGLWTGQVLLRQWARQRALAIGEIRDAMRCGTVIWWALLLIAATAFGLGSSYLPLWWCAGCAVKLLASRHLSGGRQWIVSLAGMTMAVVTTLQAAGLLLTCLVPLAGTWGRQVPADTLIAAILAMAIAPFGLLVVPVLPSLRSLRAAGLVVGSLGLVMVALIATAFPYTSERPKRVYIDVHAADEGGAHAVVETIDSGPDLPIRDVPLTGEVTRAMPVIEILPAATGSSAARAAQVRLHASGSYLVEVRFDDGPVSWRVGVDDRTGTSNHFVWVGTDDPLTFAVESNSETPVVLRVKAFYLGSDVPIDEVLAQLPPWSTPTVQTVLEASARF